MSHANFLRWEPPPPRTRLVFPPRFVIKVPDLPPTLVPGWPPVEVPYYPDRRRAQRPCRQAPPDCRYVHFNSRPQFYSPQQFRGRAQSDDSLESRDRQQFQDRQQFRDTRPGDAPRIPPRQPLIQPRGRQQYPSAEIPPQRPPPTRPPPPQLQIPPQARQRYPSDEIGPATPLNLPRQRPSPQQLPSPPQARQPGLSPEVMPPTPPSVTSQTSPRSPFQWPTPPEPILSAQSPRESSVLSPRQSLALSPGQPEARALEDTAQSLQSSPSSSETPGILGPPDPYVGSCAVVGLTRDTFRRFIRGLDAAFVLFYDPCEKNCAWAKHNMRQAAISTNRSNHAFAAVDCTKECHLCKKQGVKSYPTMKLYAKGKQVNTFTDRDMLASQDITKFVENIEAYTGAKVDIKKCVIQ